MKITKEQLLSCAIALSMVGGTAAVATVGSLEMPVEVVEEMNYEDESMNTLNKYNKYLSQYGIQLTLEDLEVLGTLLDERGMASIKTSYGDYFQVGTTEHDPYYVIENNRGTINLAYMSGKMADYYNIFEKQFFSDLYSEEEYATAVHLGEFIKKYDIQSTGYTVQEFISWDDAMKEEVLKLYGEEVFECLSLYGFPICTYDTEDFYAAHKARKTDVNVLTK